jgi:hypothetical protein
MEQEDIDIRFVKSWCVAAHVEDLDAVAALENGRGIFDISQGGRKMDAFVIKYGLQNQIQRNSLTGLVGHRKIYLAFKSKPN